MRRGLVVVLCAALTQVAATWIGTIGVMEPQSVSAQSAQCPGDFNGDGKVNLADFLAFAGGFGTRSGDANYNPRLDLNGSGSVDLSDFLAFAGVFGSNCKDQPLGSVSGDRAALIALYNATDGPNWVDNTNWLTDAPLGEWYGVETDASGRVVELNLNGAFDYERQRPLPHGLSGTLPPELTTLARLEVLELRRNDLKGTLPPEFGALAQLKVLDLAYNGLTGVVPPVLGDLRNLESLILDANHLGDPIPPELGSLAKLTLLSLAENELTGSIPAELRGLARLEALELGWNHLTGPIPPWLSELTGLRDLSLRHNEFSGPIPPELGNLASLGALLLDENQLTGPIPPELGNLASLGTLFLYFNGLTGPIPRELGRLSNLRFLSLHSNHLTGPIPSELGNLALLGSLDLAANDLTGRVPRELGNLEELRSLSLQRNQLTGSLPLSFVQLDKLENLGCSATRGLCIPANEAFREWARQVETRGNIAHPVDIPSCDEIDAQALEALYEAADGDSWRRSDGWLEDENLGRWHGVQTDSVGRVSVLDLTGNGLTGSLPDAVALLAGMKELRIGNNELTGRLPLSLAGLALEEFDYARTALCAPDNTGFQGWLNGIQRHSGPGVLCPPLTDRDILESLYWITDGLNWHNRTGWTTEAPLQRWDGVTTDAAGRVVALRLASNGLSGPIPSVIGELDHLEWLDLAGNELYGSIPSELGGLSALRSLSLYGNQISGTVPAELAELGLLQQLDLGRNKLTGEIPVLLTKLANLAVLELGSNVLSGPIPDALGSLSRLERLGLADNQLNGSVPAELSGLVRLESLHLADNRLTGRIPPELGALSRLSTLDLSGNLLTGPIPAALGGLAHLQELRLSGNAISGSIPGELGQSGDLLVLELSKNKLTGPIPAELGRLAGMVTLNLADNELSGSLPPELGSAVSLESLDLQSNQLMGPVPPQLGTLAQLKQLILADNPDLVGPLPSAVTALGRLERFMAGGTGLCRPAGSDFTTWFRGIADRRLVRCEGGAAYLTQTVQSWDDPVPLLAGEPALLRVFVTASEQAGATLPDVRATFFVDGVERHTVDISARAQPIPSHVMEGDLATSANAEIPDWVIAPGLEMVIDIDPQGTIDAAHGVTKRIPEEGRIEVDVRPVPSFDLNLIPFLLDSDPDYSAVEDVSAMAADPDGHELLRDARTLLPIAEIAVVAKEPVMSYTSDSRSTLRQVEAMRVMEGGEGYWMGIRDGRLKPGGGRGAPGVAFTDGRASVSLRNASMIAHELGHNLSLQHAPCGNPRDVDPWFPHSRGSTGAWGYDFQKKALVSREAADIMSYCTHSVYWISDFFFNKALNYRLANAAPAEEVATSTLPGHALLLWGGRDNDGVPYLDPAFVVDAVPSLPVAGGEYTIEGAAADGTPVFSYMFDMPVIGDAEGDETSFVFALPLKSEWAGNLASITLSGPGGIAVLDENTDRPMAILRDLQSGHVRGFLSDLTAEETAQAAEGTFAAKPGMEVIFSRGIPELR